MHKRFLFLAILTPFLWAQEAPIGYATTPTPQEQTQLDQLKGQVDGKIVWSSSRSNAKHDLWMMNADGSNAKQLTQGDAVDWFPRISPNGQSVLFNRSANNAWVSEKDADFPEKWNILKLNLENNEVLTAVQGATWGTWKNDSVIVFSRAAKVYTKNLNQNTESLLIDGEILFGKNVILQEPNLSPDGQYLAITLRGSKRETGILSLSTQKWTTTGDGCQIDWFPAIQGSKIYRMNPTGNGGTAAPSEVLKMNIKDGQPIEKIGFFGIPQEVKLMDLPGRRSHEYFPKVDQLKGEWLVWGATDKGHDHDLYDYELYLWKIGSPVSNATRLTFHSGNDRWPDIWLKP